jgi:hypothetical protein
MKAFFTSLSATLRSALRSCAIGPSIAPGSARVSHQRAAVIGMAAADIGDAGFRGHLDGGIQGARGDRRAGRVAAIDQGERGRAPRDRDLALGIDAAEAQALGVGGNANQPVGWDPHRLGVDQGPHRGGGVRFAHAQQNEEIDAQAGGVLDRKGQGLRQGIPPVTGGHRKHSPRSYRVEVSFPQSVAPATRPVLPGSGSLPGTMPDRGTPWPGALGSGYHDRRNHFRGEGMPWPRYSVGFFAS